MTKPESDADDFSSLDTLIDSMYQAVSGPDRGLDVELEHQVFTPDARLIRCGLDGDGRPWRKDMSLADFEEDTRDFLASQDFYEYEIRKVVTHCKPFAYVHSEYEAKSDPASDELMFGGVNSIQCLWDGSRWWIYQMMWNQRR